MSAAGAPILLAPVLVAAPPAVAVPASCSGHVATIVGTPGNDRLVGTDGPDVISGGRGFDKLVGLGGDDVLCGGVGGDHLDGGPGDDELYGGRDAFSFDRGGSHEFGDTLVPGPGDDLVDGGAEAPRPPGEGRARDVLDLRTAPQGLTVDLVAGTADGEGHDVITSPRRWRVLGSDHDDVLTGTDYSDVLAGRAGSDILIGGARGDILTGDPRNDGDDATDTLLGEDGNDRLSTGGGEDALSGGPGEDWLRDHDDDIDVLDGGSDDDRLTPSGSGHDELYAGGGDDVVETLLTPGTGGVVDGGDGENILWLRERFVRNQVEQRPRGTLDLRTGELTVEWPTPTSRTVTRFSLVHVPPRWTVWGTDAAELFRVTHDGPINVHAGGGDDVIDGTRYADHLDGGDGTDTASPGQGLDTCVSIEETGLPRDACNPTATLGPAELVTLTSAGEQTHEPGRPYSPAVSETGRYVAFQTEEALTPGDTNEVADIYVRDRRLGTTSRVSVRSNGRQASRPSASPDISGNGRFVVFSSRGGLAGGATEGPSQVYVHDRRRQRTTLVSVDRRGRPGSGSSHAPTVSSNGDRVAFRSYADNLGGSGVYVRDRSAGRTLVASLTPDGSRARGDAAWPEISADGTRVLFYWGGSHLTPSHRSGLFVRDLVAGTSEWVVNTGWFRPPASLSGDGQMVAYTRRDPDCDGSWWQCLTVLVRSLRSGDVWMASRPLAGAIADESSRLPVLSTDGRHVLFTSAATNLVVDDDNGATDVFVHDLWSRQTTRVSTSVVGGDANGPSGSRTDAAVGTAFSGDATWIVFDTYATDMVAVDANDARDLVARPWQAARMRR